MSKLTDVLREQANEQYDDHDPAIAPNLIEQVCDALDSAEIRLEQALAELKDARGEVGAGGRPMTRGEMAAWAEAFGRGWLCTTEY